MDADEYILTLCELAEQQYGVPLPEKLGMSPQQCEQWLRALHGKRLTLRDAQESVAAILARKGQGGEDEAIAELLYYI
ncbi:MAG: hypothetical protein AB1505_01230 [Candidatus Latescibacterota bacterium]